MLSHQIMTIALTALIPIQCNSENFDATFILSHLQTFQTLVLNGGGGASSTIVLVVGIAFSQ